MTETEQHSTSRALVASFLFTDLVGYSKGTAAEQYAAKATLSSTIRRNLGSLLETDYRIKDTGDGALIAFVASPEHALYMALAIAEDFGHAAREAGVPSNLLRTGLHLGSVKESIDLEARPNFVGDGINAAKRIMDFAEPGQITASQAYFDAVGSLDSTYAELFRHVGAPGDKHGRAHELYAITPSAPVLAGLRLDLAAATRESSEMAATNAVPTPHARNRAAQITGGSSATPRRSGRLIRNMLAAVVAAIAIGAVSLFLMTQPIMPKHGAAAPPSEETVSISHTSPGVLSEPEAAPRVRATDVTEQSPATGSTSPATGPTLPVPVATVTKAVPGIKPKADRPSSVLVAPAAPVATDSASDRNSPRCSRILEKATLGEALSAEEQKALAGSCR
ncbi:MAG TPA: hypothetical protein VF428_03300 [Casimicrobiaceae bacterium]